ncbi:hypothetical protein V9T40_004812 [Parthenolecanium corni]|uniref:Bystin n=1 Tax=Parthenolecanium corni TaxID=536013 RepID=A0AAN9Y284_9HEMI
MGKIKKVRSTRGMQKVSLEEQLANDSLPKQRNREPKIKFRFEEEDAKVVNSQLSKQILNQVRKQQREMEENVTEDQPSSSIMLDSDSDSEDDDLPQEDDSYQDYQLPEINEEEEKALEKFMSNNPAPRITLADIIMEKITEKQTEIRSKLSDADSIQLQDVDPRVKEMYFGVKEVLMKYRSGKLPKAFKIIPALKNWEQILFITDPASWSAAAMYQGTRIFASNLKEKMAQRFYNLVLLPRIRDDINEYKRLNFHLYQALRKALFKPGAFMKGIIIPLCESRCTLREAIIVGSVVARNSIPMLHSAATMLKLAEMEYNGPTSIFLRILFEKKYALPYRVVDAVVFHFLRFQKDQRELPVLWHQALLSFVQYYKGDISSEQRDALHALLRNQSHYQITPTIRRELESATCRDVEIN